MYWDTKLQLIRYISFGFTEVLCFLVHWLPTGSWLPNMNLHQKQRQAKLMVPLQLRKGCHNNRWYVSKDVRSFYNIGRTQKLHETGLELRLISGQGIMKSWLGIEGRKKGWRRDWCVEKLWDALFCVSFYHCVQHHFYLKQLPKQFSRFFWYISQADNCGNRGSLDDGYVPGSFTTSHVEVTAYRPCPLTPEIGQQLYIDRNQILAATTALTHRLESCLVYPTFCIYINATHYYLPKPKDTWCMISSPI